MGQLNEKYCCNPKDPSQIYLEEDNLTQSIKYDQPNMQQMSVDYNIRSKPQNKIFSSKNCQNNSIKSNNSTSTEDKENLMYLSNQQNDLNCSHKTSKWLQSPKCQESDRLDQLQQMAHYAQTLQLKVLSSQSLQKGQIFKLNCQGLENSQRGALDGFVYFGSKKRIRKQALKKNNVDDAEYKSNTIHHSEIVNDILIKSPDPEINKKHSGHHFQIEYSIDQNCYMIKDLGIGFGVFWKLDYDVVLKDNHLINIGLIFMVVNFVPEDGKEIEGDASTFMQDPHNLAKLKMKLKFYGGPCNGDVVVIDPSQQYISIGRQFDSFIHFDDQLLSKKQCIIFFDESRGWILRDGSGQSQPSTNGTWLYMGEEQRIYSGMIFKANQTVFQAQLQ